MSIKINLYFQTFVDLELLEKGVNLEVIRLLGKLEFEKEGGWSDVYPAIVDTGAPVSLIPFDIWEEAKVEVLTDYRIKGVVPKEGCSLQVKVGRVNVRLVDEEGATEKLNIMAYLAPTNKVPLIIGFKDLLANGSVYCRFENRKAFIGFY